MSKTHWCGHLEKLLQNNKKNSENPIEKWVKSMKRKLMKRKH